MAKLAPEWVRTSDPVFRSPARYRWTTAPALRSDVIRPFIGYIPSSSVADSSSLSQRLGLMSRRDDHYIDAYMTLLHI